MVSAPQLVVGLPMANNAYRDGSPPPLAHWLIVGKKAHEVSVARGNAVMSWGVLVILLYESEQYALSLMQYCRFGSSRLVGRVVGDRSVPWQGPALLPMWTDLRWQLPMTTRACFGCPMYRYAVYLSLTEIVRK